MIEDACRCFACRGRWLLFRADRWLRLAPACPFCGSQRTLAVPAEGVQVGEAA